MLRRSLEAIRQIQGQLMTELPTVIPHTASICSRLFTETSGNQPAWNLSNTQLKLKNSLAYYLTFVDLMISGKGLFQLLDTIIPLETEQSQLFETPSSKMIKQFLALVPYKPDSEPESDDRVERITTKRL